ncbi:glycosyltransferase family 4 protein [Patescibacteria group bacterium]
MKIKKKKKIVMTKNRNIIIFLNAFWNNGKGMSGGDQMLIQIFKRIRSEFGEMHCYTNVDGKKVIKDGGVDDVDFHVSERVFDKLPLGVNYVLRTIQSLGVLFGEKAGVVYGGSDFFPDVVPLFLYKLIYPKTRWVQCVFHIYPDWKTRPGNKVINFLAQYFQKASLCLVKKADTVVNINHEVGEELRRNGFDGDNIVINTPGINLEYLKNLEVQEDTKKYQGSFLARLNPSKGILDLIKIWKRVVQELPEAKLAVIGGGSDETKEELKKLIQESELTENINLLGFIENDESFSIIKKSDVFIFPSHEEGFGIAVADAMACGTPVVSWNLSVYEEIFEDKSVQVQENDMDVFAEKVIELLKDEEKNRELARKASEFVEKYSWESIAKKHKDILLK